MQGPLDDAGRGLRVVSTLSREWGTSRTVDLLRAAEAVLRGLAGVPAGPPPKLAPVFRQGLAPGEVSDEAVPDYLRVAGLTVLASGEPPLVTPEFHPDGTRVELRSRWLWRGVRLRGP
ncbi:hypothetical protein [Streptomyces coeruleorubidus]|uniref:hypothetical protein n=1 Tax=Streptomyces coeruleorubidus TaxID=116188 RepID=UPI003F53B7BB